MCPLLLDMAFKQLAGSLYLRNVFKGILGNEEKAPGRKVQVKEIGRLFKGAEVLPVPLLASLFGLQQNAAIVQLEGKMILEGGIAPINAQRKEPPDRQPEKEPQKGEKYKRLNPYFLEKQ